MLRSRKLIIQPWTKFWMR
ncbi:Protein CBG27946 [Caenorhabditis briggsae]|uniref:Protein CBG27946 n=1 Tax=Caenorhabditis briggsae TaxID=6238 RepID=B6IJN8_CAEBR|nr:Protein CBG27946 [Caenorhabditis briggsae]CAS00118.1 Protein CBG27946 [Caenorhabditis briggsae]